MARRTATLLAALSLALVGLVPASASASTEVTAYTAQLSGAQEVPPNSSLARGSAVLQLNADGTALEFRLIAANIENVVMAHIHAAPAGTNGPIVAFLLHPQSDPGRSDGVLATGTITAANLTGPLAGQSLDALVAALESGGAYVNVHTTQLPAGEIRGQIH
ncbi:CHRD domain-containing protein [Streptomyces sp. NPDC051940]|uniref:CHRD domain-containing protein n=1 Tax=Streptomyces sp. NPDC051940 TaxID=3155675 RepID=UPI003432E368